MCPRKPTSDRRGARIRPHRIPILTYHSLNEPMSVISTAPSVFERQMRWLSERDYRVIPLSVLVRRLRAGEGVPPRTAAITFDDGFLSVYTSAMPVLARFGFPATVFLVTGYCGLRNDWPGQPDAVPRYPLLDWTHIREMDGRGFEFGAHTVTHPRLDRLAPEQVEREIIGSKTQIEDRLGHAVDLFAYPYGRWTPYIRGVVGRAYVGACTTFQALVGPDTDPLALSRIEAHYIPASGALRGLTGLAFPAYLAVRRVLRTAASLASGRDWI